MSLGEYQKKRDFDISPEPKGEIKIIGEGEIQEETKNVKGDVKGRIFVVHKHHAKRLHWDLRLEIGGVLRSWAVPKDPGDVNKGMRRLAIHVEDHPIEYADFEGIIPPGMYGAGTVAIWDKGEFVLKEETENKLNFELKGKKLNGAFSLIHTPNIGEKSWLFFKKMTTF